MQLGDTTSALQNHTICLTSDISNSSIRKRFEQDVRISALTRTERPKIKSDIFKFTTFELHLYYCSL